MAFTEAQLAEIEAKVGGLCRRKSPAHLTSEVRIDYVVERHTVTIVERRAPWRAGEHWSAQGCARFKYTANEKRWKLYWMRRDLKWHAYQLDRPLRSLAALVEEVEIDEYGAFFG